MDALFTGICGALFASLAYFSLRRIGNVFPTTLTVWVFLLVLAFVSITLKNEKWVAPENVQLSWLVVVGVLGLVDNC